MSRNKLLMDYKAPEWLLKHVLFKQVEPQVPKYRLNLLLNARPTPIQKLETIRRTSNATELYELSVKRDDLTSHEHSYLQGNKLRKLEFIFADAIQRNNDQKKQIHVLTAGGLQSNHARTVAGVARLLDMKAHLFLRSHTENKSNDLDHNGNLLLNRLLGADVYLIEKRAQYVADIEHKMKELRAKLLKKYGEENCNVYLIPIGGSNLHGLFGYFEAFDELIRQQDAFNRFDDIIVTTGSGGTMAALAIANYLTGSRFKLHAFCVCDNKSYFYAHLADQLDQLLGGRHKIDVKSMVNLIECSKGWGYAKFTRDELQFQIEFMQRTGLLIDPVYTGKTLYALYNLLHGKRPTQLYESEQQFVRSLKGNRLLFIHTGGQLGMFGNQIYNQSINNHNQNQNQNQNQNHNQSSSIHNCFNENMDKLNL